jgi:hypothetical protein
MDNKQETIKLTLIMGLFVAVIISLAEFTTVLLTEWGGFESEALARAMTTFFLFGTHINVLLYYCPELLLGTLKMTLLHKRRLEKYRKIFLVGFIISIILTVVVGIVSGFETGTIKPGIFATIF